MIKRLTEETKEEIQQAVQEGIKTALANKKKESGGKRCS